jgi:hypothetical protein
VLISVRNAFVSLEKVYFSQDTTISVRSRGIKPEYALLNFCRDNISVFYLYALCNLGKSEIEGKLTLFE